MKSNLLNFDPTVDLHNGCFGEAIKVYRRDNEVLLHCVGDVWLHSLEIIIIKAQVIGDEIKFKVTTTIPDRPIRTDSNVYELVGEEVTMPLEDKKVVKDILVSIVTEGFQKNLPDHRVVHVAKYAWWKLSQIE